MKIPPPELLIQVSNDPDPDHYRAVAPVQWAVEQPLHAAGFRLADFDRILDFGCGAGRLLQTLNLARRPGQELFGCDVNEACATWCRDNLDFATVAHTALAPPLPYADASFDLIVGISVFTHLSRPLQVAWARELMRILRPRGVALVTTWGLGILPDVLAIDHRWSVREHALFGATGHFLHYAEGAASALEGQREVVALHDMDAVARIFAPLWLAFHADISPVAAGQDASVLVKPDGGCRVTLPSGAASFVHDAVAEVPAGGRASGTVALDFADAGESPLRFRSYVEFGDRRFDLVHFAVDCRIRDAVSHRLLVAGRFAFPSSVTLGPGHLIPFSLECPAARALRVELAVKLLRAPWQPDAIRFRWWDSRLEVAPRPTADGVARRTPAEMVRLEIADL
jgi:SAM-dependent methyltransferase